MANIDKHGYDFAQAEDEFEWDSATTTRANAGSHGEARFKSIGLFRGRLIVVILAPLGTEAISIISMRLADRKERALYENEEE